MDVTEIRKKLLQIFKVFNRRRTTRRTDCIKKVNKQHVIASPITESTEISYKIVYVKYAQTVTSRVAQWKRAGPITQRSVDRNHALLIFFSSDFFFIFYVVAFLHRFGINLYCLFFKLILLTSLLRLVKSTVLRKSTNSTSLHH